MSSRMRGRDYSYSPSPPPRGYRGRARSPSPRGRYGGRSRDLPTSLLVRNLRHDCRPEDLRKPFGQFGPLKDIYLPRDYYSGEPRGFGFVQFVHPNDAAEAKYQLDGQILLGRELTVVYAEENRKKPVDMRARERVSRSYGSRRSPRSRSPYRSRSRSPRRSSRYSPPPRYARSRSRSFSHHSPSPSPRRRRVSRSVSPDDHRTRRERSYSRSPNALGLGSRSPSEDDEDVRKGSHREVSRSVSR
ncbi:Serine/arginine-rich splicing factor 33 [Platanthera guangdongensis]|uniref:Serine/arginine-rich splicing factor 33 n=1 Tax=Platanthera guangdongensis TaxID=2320717 RepID=A0ABR2MWU3_9ASPA